MGKKTNKILLGKSIIKDRFKSSKQLRNTDEGWLHTSDLNDGYEWGRLNLNSVTEQSHLDDFLMTAELAGTEFTAERQNIRVVDPNASSVPSAAEIRAIQEAQELNKDLLCIPRRPKWDATTSKENLAQMERESFLEWRRRLAMLQEKEHVVMTPFERNLEFWRQLWRVIERSDIVVQIVDARNPLLFRCEDLERYVKEMGSEKQNMVLISKADLLTQRQRQEWADYFSRQGMKIAFWSALLETERIKREAAEEKEEHDDDDDEGEASESDEDDEDDDNVVSSRSRFVLKDEMSGDEEAPTSATSGETDSEDTDTEARDCDPCIPQPDDGQAGHSSTDPEMPAHEGPTPTGEGARPTSPPPTGRTPDNRESESKPERMSARETVLSELQSDESAHQSLEAASSNTVRFSDLELTGSAGDGCNEAAGLDGRGLVSGCGQGDGGNEGKPRPVENIVNLLTGEELIQFFYDLQTGPQVEEGVTTVGMVGYPNVGKSSTINAILQQKKVPVSATPGRTKHFQTLYVEPTMCLCDCPGLVMPSMVSAKAEMIVSGILCIDHLRDCIPPISLLCQRIPRHVLNSLYGINIIKPRDGEDLNRIPTAREFLSAFSYMRGFMTHHGIPDCPRAARIVLKDYVKGKLLYCHPPPGIDAVEFQAFAQQEAASTDENAPTMKREISGPVVTDEGTMLKKQPTSSKLDEAFFSQRAVTSHTMGTVGPRGGIGQNQGSALTASQQRLLDKPWKKHGNRNKREKLRRVYAHHDE